MQACTVYKYITYYLITLNQDRLNVNSYCNKFLCRRDIYLVQLGKQTPYENMKTLNAVCSQHSKTDCSSCSETIYKPYLRNNRPLSARRGCVWDQASQPPRQAEPGVAVLRLRSVMAHFIKVESVRAGGRLPSTVNGAKIDSQRVFQLRAFRSFNYAVYLRPVVQQRS